MKNLIKLNTARNCLRYLIRAYNIKEIFIPYYICPTIWQAIQKENCKINFYHITQDFLPVQEFDIDAFILYPNYFGICGKNIKYLASKYKNLILDSAHSFYTAKSYEVLASFCSLRKFFDVADGALLYTSKIIDIDLKKSENYDFKKLKSYDDFCSNEARLDNNNIMAISELSESTIKNIDIKKQKEDRLKLFRYFENKYKNTNKLKIDILKNEVPFVYPLLTTDKKILTELLSQDILFLRYWNELPKQFTEYEFSKDLVPIPLKDYYYKAKG